VAGAHRLEREIPGAKVVVLDAGHFLFADQPEAAAATVVEFLAETGV
jgi:pimeloyl-ACP methyl ester carboxylesterase